MIRKHGSLRAEFMYILQSLEDQQHQSEFIIAFLADLFIYTAEDKSMFAPDVISLDETSLFTYAMSFDTAVEFL